MTRLQKLLDRELPRDIEAEERLCGCVLTGEHKPLLEVPYSWLFDRTTSKLWRTLDYMWRHDIPTDDAWILKKTLVSFGWWDECHAGFIAKCVDSGRSAHWPYYVDAVRLNHWRRVAIMEAASLALLLSDSTLSHEDMRRDMDAAMDRLKDAQQHLKEVSRD